MQFQQYWNYAIFDVSEISVKLNGRIHVISLWMNNLAI